MADKSAGSLVIVLQRRSDERRHVRFVSHLLHNVATLFDMTAASVARLQPSANRIARLTRETFL